MHLGPHSLKPEGLDWAGLGLTYASNRAMRASTTHGIVLNTLRNNRVTHSQYAFRQGGVHRSQHIASATQLHTNDTMMQICSDPPPTTKVPRGLSFVHSKFIVCLSFLTSISKTSHVIIEIILSGRKQEDRNAKQNEWMRQQSLLYSMTNRTSEQLQGVVLTRGQKLFFNFLKKNIC